MAEIEKTTPNYDWQVIGKDLAGSGALALLILTPIVTFKTTMNQGSLILTSRWYLVVPLVAIVVLGRLLFHQIGRAHV